MPRRPDLIPSRSIHVRIPEDLLARMDLFLFSNVEGKVPYGEHSRFIAARLREYFEWTQLDLAAAGLPAGYFIRGPHEMVQAVDDKLKGKA